MENGNPSEKKGPFVPEEVGLRSDFKLTNFTKLKG
jgi:hypothetical protein